MKHNDKEDITNITEVQTHDVDLKEEKTNATRDSIDFRLRLVKICRRIWCGFGYLTCGALALCFVLGLVVYVITKLGLEDRMHTFAHILAVIAYNCILVSILAVTAVLLFVFVEDLLASAFGVKITQKDYRDTEKCSKSRNLSSLTPEETNECEDIKRLQGLGATLLDVTSITNNKLMTAASKQLRPLAIFLHYLACATSCLSIVSLCFLLYVYMCGLSEEFASVIIGSVLLSLIAVVLVLITNIPSIYTVKKAVVHYTYCYDVPTDKLPDIKAEFGDALQVIRKGDTTTSISVSTEHPKKYESDGSDIAYAPIPAAVGIYIIYILTHPAVFSDYLPFLAGKTIPIEIACAIGSVIAIVLYGIWFKEILTVENQAKK